MIALQQVPQIFQTLCSASLKDEANVHLIEIKYDTVNLLTSRQSKPNICVA